MNKGIRCVTPLIELALEAMTPEERKESEVRFKQKLAEIRVKRAKEQEKHKSE